MKNKLPRQPNCLERYLVHYKRIKRILNTVKIGPTDKPDSFGELVRIKIYILHVSKNLMKNQKIEVMLDLSDRYTHLTELAANYHGSTNDTSDNLNTFDNLICEIKTRYLTVQMHKCNQSNPK